NVTFLRTEKQETSDGNDPDAGEIYYIERRDPYYFISSENKENGKVIVVLSVGFPPGIQPFPSHENAVCLGIGQY
ncbi:MAG: hypothetical protein V1832_00610, partial [Nitrospirota bacterium]